MKLLLILVLCALASAQTRTLMGQDYREFGPGHPFNSLTGVRTEIMFIRFPTEFASTPAVTLSLFGVDIDVNAPVRLTVTPQDITREGFNVLFRTWLDTKVYAGYVTWIAVGE